MFEWHGNEIVFEKRTSKQSVGIGDDIMLTTQVFIRGCGRVADQRRRHQDQNTVMSHGHV